MEKKEKIKTITLIILVVLFIVNITMVILNKFESMDNLVHNIIRFSDSEIIDSLMKFITFFGSTVWIAILIIAMVIFYFVKKEKHKAKISFMLLAISTIINNVIKLIIRRPRPEYITVIEKSFSYPSGHTMAATTVYGTLIYFINKSNLNKPIKIISSILLGILILFVGISRIYLGAHFFSDVLGGFLLSLIIIIVFSIYNSKNKIV